MPRVFDIIVDGESKLGCILPAVCIYPGQDCGILKVNRRFEIDIKFVVKPGVMTLQGMRRCHFSIGVLHKIFEIKNSGKVIWDIRDDGFDSVDIDRILFQKAV